MSDTKRSLSYKQQRFIKEYMKDFNGKAAAIRAGYAPKYADRQAHLLLVNTRVKKALNQAIETGEQLIDITIEELANEMLAIVQSANIYEFVNIINGRALLAKKPEDLTVDQQRCIQSLKETEHGIEVKLHDKTKYIEMLAKWKGMFKDTGESENTLNINLNYKLGDQNGEKGQQGKEGRISGENGEEEKEEEQKEK